MSFPSLLGSMEQMTEGYEQCEQGVPIYTPLEEMDHNLDQTLTNMDMKQPSDPVTMFDQKVCFVMTQINA